MASLAKHVVFVWLIAPVFTAPVLRSSRRLHPDAHDTVSLKRMQLDLPLAADNGDQGFDQRLVDNEDQRLVEGSLPVYVPSHDEKEPLIQRHYLYNFSSQEVSDLNYSRSHGLDANAHCTPLNTIFDLGFYDGADSAAYLTGGYCVVGVEADPDLVAMALQKYAVWVASGQLRIANVAVAPQGETSAWTVFYKSKCSKEWNSFIKTVGCRACVPPHGVDMNACEQVQVTSTDCSGIFGTFGIPHYLKLDIEGAETGCFEAMKRFPAGTEKPHFVSAEITELAYLDALSALGYKGFKLVRQDQLISASTRSSTSGPWGDNALDCRTGPWWRTYDQVTAEFTTILSKELNTQDPCPGGIMPIHGSPKPAEAYMWYDVHASLIPPAR